MEECVINEFFLLSQDGCNVYLLCLKVIRGLSCSEHCSIALSLQVKMTLQQF